MYRNLVLVFFGLISNLSFSQNPFTIYGFIEGNVKVKNTPVLLRSFSVDEFVPIVQVNVSDGSFEVPLIKNHAHGLYALEIVGYGSFEFIVGPTDSELRVNIDVNNPSKRPTTNSNENKVYWKLLSEFFHKNHLTDSIGSLRGNVSRVDKQYYYKKTLYRSEVDSVIKAYHERLDQLAQAFPNTYTTDVLIPLLRGKTRLDSEELQVEYDNHHSFYHHTFLDNINLSDFRLLNHPLFSQQMKIFLREYSGEFKEDHIASVDRLFSRCENEKVKTFLLNLATRHYWMSGEREVAKYVISNYSDGCADNLDEIATKDGVLFPSLKTGDPIPLFSWNTDNLTILSSDVIKENRLTLLLFWKSDCDHCEREVPLIVSSSSPYVNNGLGIIAISMDNDSLAWKKTEGFIPETWINLLQKDILSKARLSNQLSVYSTPSTVLVDQNGRFLAANIFRERLDKFLAGYLN